MRSGFWFLVVGSSAALTHMTVYWLVLPALLPELANVAGFCAAFVVSFTGHRFLSFTDADTGLWQSLRRFAITAVAGFAANELTFVILLRVLHLPDLLALFLALVLAAVQTFVLSRYWAFRRVR